MTRMAPSVTVSTPDSRRRAPRLLLASLAFVATLALEGRAQAQYANHSFGFEAGYFAPERAVGIKGGPVFGIDSTLYIDGGFDLYFRVLAGIHQEVVMENNVIGMFPAIGFRYLLSEDTVRPYLGFNLSMMHFFQSNLSDLLFAVNPHAGLEFYPSNDFALGVQAEYHRILVLNGTGGNAFGLIARAAWGF